MSVTVVSRKFAAHLEAWGPESGAVESDLQQAFRYCRRLAMGHYENFPVASLALPRSVQQHFFNVYAFCRWSDDLSDEVADTSESLALLSWWRGELDRCYGGDATHPVFVALRVTIRAHEIPREPFDRLIDAFEQDQRVFEYETFEQLRGYCRGSADPVGRLVLYLTGQASEENFVYSDSVCTGLQLANFWQDVARDYELGRVYLPAEDRARFGYGAEQLGQRTQNRAFRELMQFEVERARELLLSGRPLVARFPFRMQIVIDMFLRGGVRILERIERIDYGVWARRPVVTRFDMLRILINATARALVRAVRDGRQRRSGRKPSRRGEEG